MRLRAPLRLNPSKARILLRELRLLQAFASRIGASTILGVLLAAVLTAPGCDLPSPGWNTVQVWGRVTYNGQPVKGGLLIFEPGSSSNTNWGAAAISAEGKYAVVPSQFDVDLEPGRFVIFLRPPTPETERKRGRFGEEINKPETEANVAVASYPVPDRFFKPETSKLWIDLQKEPTRVDIDLKD
jgi:hypothetical protein